MGNFFVDGGVSRDTVIVGAVEEVRQQTIDLLRDSLASYDAVTTGELAQSIDVRYELKDGGMIVSIYMDEYWKFVDKGVKGTQDEKAPNSPYSYKSSKDSIPANLLSGTNGWIAAKGISLSHIASNRKDKNGHFVKRKRTLTNPEANKTLAFAMAKSIHKKGVKAQPFYSDVINEKWVKSFAVKMGEALKQDIIDAVIIQPK